jgi:putative hydrolase of the HAD superfamily
MGIRVVAFDGDDTLWHNETRFHLTQDALRTLLKGHAPEADVDRHLAEVEQRNLALYGYGIKAFTLSMLETAIEITEGRIPTSDLRVILGWGRQMLGQPVDLLEGVQGTLVEAGMKYKLLVITKGDLFDQESKVARSGLAELFEGVEIVSEKKVEVYRAILERRSIQPGEFVMVGNSLRSDIAPVVELGGRAIHIPYPLTWHHEDVAEEEMPANGWYRVDRISEVGRLLGSLDEKQP